MVWCCVLVLLFCVVLSLCVEFRCMSFVMRVCLVGLWLGLTLFCIVAWSLLCVVVLVDVVFVVVCFVVFGLCRIGLS